MARALKLDRSAAYRRIRAALEGGYLKNLENRERRPARLVLGEPLPDDAELLPALGVQVCTSVRGDTLPPSPPSLTTDPPMPPEVDQETGPSRPASANGRQPSSAHRRAALIELGAALGWPQLHFKPGHSIAPGELAWLLFAECADGEDVATALAVAQAERAAPL